MGASLGAYHAANTLFKHPDVVKRCYALSGRYDMKRSMNGHYDDNFYFNNPVDYLANLTDPGRSGTSPAARFTSRPAPDPWENSGESYRLSGILASRGVRIISTTGGRMAGHDWPYWKHQLREYLGIEGLMISSSCNAPTKSNQRPCHRYPASR